MNVPDMTERILKSYERYYNIRKENVCAPFVAEAIFHSHNEQYIFIKSAKLSEQDSSEFVFFANEESLSADRIRSLDEIAWKEGLSRVTPHKSHRNSDVTLVIIAETVSKEAVSCIKKLHHYKSYHLGLQGWSNYRVIVLETSTGSLTHNRHGRELRKLYQKIIKNS